jgi:SpoVK/Ycf46/Vps4 family AAA+-type ATPase
MSIKPTNTLVFEEYFQDNRHGWSVKDSDEVGIKITANSYLFEHKRENGCWLVWNNSKTQYFRPDLEFHTQVVLEKLAGSSGEYGITWSLVDSDNYIDFVISEQNYQIRKVEAGNWTTYASGKIITDSHQPQDINVLEIRRKEEVVEFYLNSRCVSQLSAELLLSGSAFGLVIYNRLKIKAHSIIITINELEPTDAKNKAKTSKSSQSDRKLQASCIEHYPPENDTLDRVFADLNDLIGHDRTKQQFVTLENFLKVQADRQARGMQPVNLSMHLVMCGPPGTGKTVISRLVGRLYKQMGCLQSGHTIEVDRAGLVGGYIGQTAQKVDDAIERALDGVLFIDEAPALNGEDDNDFGHEAIQILLKRMEDYRDRLAVIVTGYRVEMIDFLKSNPGLASRFNQQLDIDRYTPDEMVSIFNKFCRENDYTLDFLARLELQNIFEDACSHQLDRTFANGRFVRNLFEHTIKQQANRIVSSLGEIDDRAISLITKEDLLSSHQKIVE